MVLPCFFPYRMNSSSQRVEWRRNGWLVFLYDGSVFRTEDQRFAGRVSHYEDKLLHGDASVKITNTTAADSGNYTCYHNEHQQSIILVGE